MEQKYLIDTNIIIYYLNGEIPDEQFNKVTNIFQNSFNISTITKIEVLGWHRVKDAEKNKIENFLKVARVFYIDELIENAAINLKQKCKIAIPDALIGATAILNDFTIVTRNESDFEKIEGITIYNPFETSN